MTTELSLAALLLALCCAFGATMAPDAPATGERSGYIIASS